MLKRNSFLVLCLVISSIGFHFVAYAHAGNREENQKELTILKEHDNHLKELFAKWYKDARYQEESSVDGGGLQEDEKKTRGKQTFLSKYIGEFDFGGAIELEAFYELTNPKEGEKEKTSELALSSVEFIVEAEIKNCLRASIQVEKEDEKGVVIDKAIAHFQADGVCKPDPSFDSSWYGSIGKMDIPFGLFESHLISDPLTLELGETKGKAIVIGAHNNLFNAYTGMYNGNMVKTGSVDHIENFFGAVYFTTKEDTLGFVYGICYISNIADSDGLIDFIEDKFEKDTIEENVPGASVSLSVCYNEQYYLEAEYVLALKEFKENKNFEPKAWNIEFAFLPVNEVEVTLGYSGSKDTLDFLPESHIGISGVYEIFDNVNIGLECFYEKLENNDATISAISQFRIEF